MSQRLNGLPPRTGPGFLQTYPSSNTGGISTSPLGPERLVQKETSSGMLPRSRLRRPLPRRRVKASSGNDLLLPSQARGLRHPAAALYCLRALLMMGPSPEQGERRPRRRRRRRRRSRAADRSESHPVSRRSRSGSRVRGRLRRERLPLALLRCSQVVREHHSEERIRRGPVDRRQSRQQGRGGTRSCPCLAAGSVLARRPRMFTAWAMFARRRLLLQDRPEGSVRSSDASRPYVSPRS